MENAPRTSEHSTQARAAAVKEESEEQPLISFFVFSLCSRVQPKYTRAECHLGGWVLVPDADDPSKTHLTMVASADMKGSMPAYLKQKINEKQPAMVNEREMAIAATDSIDSELHRTTRRQLTLVRCACACASALWSKVATIRPLLAKRMKELAKLASSSAEKHAEEQQKLAALVAVLPTYTAQELEIAMKTDQEQRAQKQQQEPVTAAAQ